VDISDRWQQRFVDEFHYLTRIQLIRWDARFNNRMQTALSFHVSVGL